MASLVELMRTLPVDEAEALLQKYEAELAAPPEEPAPDFSTGWEVARTPIEEQAYQRYLDYRNPPAPEEEPIEDPSFLRRAGDISVKYGAMIPKTYAGLLSLAGDIPGVNVVADPLARGLYKSADVAEELLLSDYQRGKERELQSAIEAASMQLGPDATFDDYLSQFQAQGGAVLDYLQENPAQVLPMITESIAALRTGARTLRGPTKAVAACSHGHISGANFRWRCYLSNCTRRPERRVPSRTTFRYSCGGHGWPNHVGWR